mmetsp:Transcript_99683/g.282086  ORF Transcript_99683/g.282086 Transcript_99683/m.282086 type:complete len:952 (-) Transcript_99683:54-2909(-)
MADGAGVPEEGAAEAPEARGAEESPDEWKRLGGEAYKAKDWKEALRCYSAALRGCKPDSAIAVACLNNRAACHAQLKDHESVILDTTAVIEKEPANLKALLRRMVSLDDQGRREEALKDASSVLTMDEKNVHALQIVKKKRDSLTKNPKDNLQKLPQGVPIESLSVFLFTEDRPLQCYACIRSLKKHVKQVRIDLHVFWQASTPACFQSYQLLQSLPETTGVQYGKVAWLEVSRGQLFPAFSRVITKMSVAGQAHVLLLSDKAIFHTDVDATVALNVLREREVAFTARFDINPRVNYFPEFDLLAPAPRMQNFADDPQVVLWTRWYDKSKQAFEKVSRESGWNAILDWTATMVRVQHVQHFFSALLPPIDTLRDLDEKAADWLSRRQRMKRSELKQRSACYRAPVLVTIDPSEFGNPEAADGLLRAHLLRGYGLDGNAGEGKLDAFAKRVGWKPQEVTDYFKGVDSQVIDAKLEGLFEPERYRSSYFDSTRVPPIPPACPLPKAINPPNPLVSWLVPVRNSEEFVLDCLASIETQTGLGAGCQEIILFEDGSEDETRAILRKFAASKPYVKVIENMAQLGVSGALSEAWPLCRGEFVARLDADDEAEPDRLVKQLRYLEQHPTVSVLGGATRSFWTEHRKCTVEKITEKEDGKVVAVIWREFHGNQTSRRREQITLQERGDEVHMVDGPAEYDGCRLIRVGKESLTLNPQKWRAALRAAKGGVSEVILQRRDPLEPACEMKVLHPVLVRATMVFEECISGTTAMLRRAHFEGGRRGERQAEGPFQREHAEGHWTLLTLEPHQHAANIADVLVRTRRHTDNRAARDQAAIYESKCAAVQHHLTKVHAANVDMYDAAAILHCRGPRTPQQGDKLVDVLQEVEHSYLNDFIRPKAKEARGDFWQDFVQGREVALERSLVEMRMRFKELADEVAKAITDVPEHSPRQHRSRTPPR